MDSGDQRGRSHSGLHLIANFTKANGNALAGTDIVTGNTFAGGDLGGRNTSVSILDVDLRAKTIRANVNIYGTDKMSTFFPVGTTLTQAKGYIRAAWKDFCTYGSAAYGYNIISKFR